MKIHLLIALITTGVLTIVTTGNVFSYTVLVVVLNLLGVYKCLVSAIMREKTTNYVKIHPS